MKFLSREAAIEISFSQKRLQQVGILDQCLAQEAAVAEDHDCVVRQEVVAVELPHHLARGLAHQALKEDECRIRIGRFGQESWKGADEGGRKPFRDPGEVLFGALGIMERYVNQRRGQIKRLPGIGWRSALGQGCGLGNSA